MMVEYSPGRRRRIRGYRMIMETVSILLLVFRNSIMELIWQHREAVRSWQPMTVK